MENNTLSVPELARTVAYELAEAYVSGKFGGLIAVLNHEHWAIMDDTFDWDHYLTEIRQQQIPTAFTLQLYGYISHYNQDMYHITSEALALLVRPAIPPTVFISHAQKTSAAFALLIQEHLRKTGIADAFVDKQLEIGADWLEQLEEEIKKRDYLLLLLTPATLASPNVRQEIRWAIDHGKVIIPVWHNNFTGYDNLPADMIRDCNDQEIFPDLSKRQAVIVEKENALGYDNAITQILNRFGYAV